MQATLDGPAAPHPTARRFEASAAPWRRLEGTRATLSALGPALLTLVGIHRH